MKNKLIKKLSIVSALVLTLSTSVLADGTGKMIEQTVDGIKSTLMLTGDKAKTGENQLTLKLSDDKNNPINNADVKVSVEMDKGSMGDMSMDASKPETIQFKKGHEDGEYVGTVKFSDKGEWKVKTSFMTGSVEKMADFNVDVVSSGPNFLVVGGFLVVTALIIITAGISKKNKKAIKS
ncbi:FixH family protein [Clostridium sp. P21]|uniref:FixH family protein n=1 Tax=Clostridium muellerianum TaxID=2716538 RepID=A0A7Y0EHR2_9CLOT|nr:FixH family protein [Clostridium muellerianum]NMM63327.1 FixH family protein [Clostridium muellerianum]